ncbi:MAG: hypothetical protein JWP14_2063 [Frankiales bacterium]|nr:hypothetical protein [Frankiales bacterium]
MTPDERLGQRLAEQCREATATMTFRGWAPTGSPRHQRALIALAAATVLLVVSVTAVLVGASHHTPPASRPPSSTGQWGGICAGSWKQQAPAGTDFTTTLRFGGILVQPANGRPQTPTEHQLRTRYHSDFLRPFPGSQLRYGLVTRFGLSSKPQGMWVLTTCGHLSTPDKPTPGNPHPQDRVYPELITYSLIDADLKWSQPISFQLGDPVCPVDITAHGVPDTAHPSNQKLVTGHVTGGELCTFDPFVGKYPGSQRGVAGLPEKDAQRLATALNSVGGSGHEVRSCENPAINEVDILAFSTSDGPQQVWIIRARCPRFTNGELVTGEAGAAYDHFRQVLNDSNAGNILRR